MTNVENYSNLIDGIFGAGTTTFDKTKDIHNNVIGALNHPEYSEFTANFTARLQRLNRIYAVKPAYLQNILVTVNEIAKKNWEGAFAELAAFDHLNQDILRHKTSLRTPIRPHVMLDNSETFALQIGMSAANLDGFVEDCQIYFDVKTFKDNVTEILEGIYRDMERHLGRTDFHIAAEYDLEISYQDFQSKREDLFKELKTSIIPGATKHLKSSVVPNLTYNIVWGSGITTAVRSYDPFSHAENYHKFIFNYANKFVKGRPSIIVLVTFPWYNQVISEFGNANTKLYRALARRVFCQYRHDTTPFKSFNSKFSDTDTFYEVSNHLSGIIFLEDNTILSKEPDKTNVKSYIYLNPNAINPVMKSMAREFIYGLHNKEFDDFEHDNY